MHDCSPRNGFSHQPTPKIQRAVESGHTDVVSVLLDMCAAPPNLYSAIPLCTPRTEKSPPAHDRT
jgi:hypothetical protein